MLNGRYSLKGSLVSLTSFRCEAVRHCRWVDEVISDCPWILDAAFLEKWKIDYVAHDEEPYVADGHNDVYAFVKQRGEALQGASHV